MQEFNCVQRRESGCKDVTYLSAVQEPSKNRDKFITSTVRVRCCSYFGLGGGAGGKKSLDLVSNVKVESTCSISLLHMLPR